MCIGEASTMKRKRYTNFSDSNRAEISQYTAIIVTTHLLIKIEGGAKIGIYCSFAKIRSQITWPKNDKIAKVSHTQNIISLRY